MSQATETCCDCGMQFSIPASIQAARRKDGKSFYCPNGHSQYYTDSENAQLRRQVRKLKEDYEYMKSRRDSYRDRAETVERSRAAYMGVITKLRKKHEPQEPKP